MQNINALEKLRPGDHACCIYGSREEFHGAIVPFVLQGLERGEKVIYIHDSRTAAEILGSLRLAGCGADDFISSGRLIMMTPDEIYLRGGFFDPDAMIRRLGEAEKEALSEGYSALRVTGEMSWVLKGPKGGGRLMEYEAKLNRFFPGSKSLAVCQYDRRKFPPEVLIDALRTHPAVLTDGGVHDNFYYIPPCDFPGEETAEKKLSRWIGRISKKVDPRDFPGESAEEAAAGIAHLLRNVLCSISSAAQGLEKREELDVSSKKYLGIILKNSKTANTLISGLVEFAAHVEPRLERGSIADVLESALRAVKTDFSDRGVRVNWIIRGNAPRVLMDEPLLKNAFIKIAANALDAMPEGGDLVIKVAYIFAEDEVEISIIDSGSGIPRESIGKIFTPFYSSRQEKLGLGLTVARRIIALHNGRVEVKSDSRGSRVIVTLPADSRETRS